MKKETGILPNLMKINEMDSLRKEFLKLVKTHKKVGEKIKETEYNFVLLKSLVKHEKTYHSRPEETFIKNVLTRIKTDIKLISYYYENFEIHLKQNNKTE